MIAQLNDISQIWLQWMGSMFWQVSLLIIIVTALDTLIRKWAWPQLRYALWALVFIKLIIPPAWEMPTSIVSWLQPQVEKRVSVQIGISNEDVNSTNALLLHDDVKDAPPVSNQNTISTHNNTKEVIAEAFTWKTWFLFGWISGMILFIFLLTRKSRHFRNWRREQSLVDIPEWHKELVQKTCKNLKIKTVPAVIISKDIKSPAVYGIIKQHLILPEGYMEKLSREQAEHVLIHELFHLKRGDLLVHWFCIALQIVYWFNPLLIWARRKMRYICEICCDLSVANVLREKTSAYRETLLHSARELFAESMEPGLGFLGIFEEPFRLVPRLKWLEKRSWENRKRRITATILSTLFMVICIMPMAGISQTSEYNSDEMNVPENKDEADALSYMLDYRMLIIEADGKREFDFGSTAYPNAESGFQVFNDGIIVNPTFAIRRGEKIN